jgi:hypothetical protein
MPSRKQVDSTWLEWVLRVGIAAAFGVAWYLVHIGRCGTLTLAQVVSLCVVLVPSTIVTTYRDVTLRRGWPCQHLGQWLDHRRGVSA